VPIVLKSGSLNLLEHSGCQGLWLDSFTLPLLKIYSSLIKNGNQLFDNFAIMFIIRQRSEKLERKSRKPVCGLKKTAFSFQVFAILCVRP
jgi:hypothetical protein